MKYVIRLTESELYRIVGDITTRLLYEGIESNMSKNDSVIRMLNDLGLGGVINKATPIHEADNSLSQSAAKRLVRGASKEPIPVRDQNKVKTNIENDGRKITPLAKKPAANGEYDELADYRGFDIDKENLGLKNKDVLKTNGEYDPKKSRKAIAAGYTPSINNAIRRGQEYHDIGVSGSLDDDSKAGRNFVAAAVNATNDEENFARTEEFRNILRMLVPLYLDGKRTELDYGGKMIPVVFKGEEKVTRASNMVFDYYDFSKDMQENEKYSLLSKKYGIEPWSIAVTILAVQNVLRNSQSFATTIRDALSGRYDFVNGRLIDNSKSPVPRSKENEKEMNSDEGLMKHEYIEAIKSTYKKFTRTNKCPKFNLPDDSNIKYTNEEFKLILIRELLSDYYESLTDSEKKVMLGRIDKQYNRLFYSKWGDKIKQ